MKTSLTRSLAVLLLLAAYGMAPAAPARNQANTLAEIATPKNVDQILASLKKSGFIKSVYLSDDSTGVLPQHNVEILQAVKEIREATSPGEAEKALVNFSNKLQQTDYRSSVTFVTKRNNKTVHGARIRYKAIGRKLIHSVAELSTSKKATMLPIGIYYFWAERNGAQTSERLTLSVVEKKKVIDLVETD